VLIDGRSMPEGESVETDLCIVGCGPAGITLARELARPGLRLTIVESGGPTRTREADVLGAGESVGYPYLGLDRTRTRGIGGSSAHWEVGPSAERWTARPLDPLDFETREGIPDSGWPITHQEMDPYYRRAQSISRLGPFAYAPNDWPDDESRSFALDDAEVRTNLVQLGDETFESYRDELTDAPDIRVIHDATVLGLVTDGEGNRVSKADIATQDGRRFTITARRFVLAAGGIENARLLLSSGRPHDRSGLGNEQDLVGRYFMERLTARAGVVIPAGPELMAQGEIYRSHVIGQTRIQGVLSLAPDVVRRERLHNAMFWVHDRPRSVTAGGVGSAMSIYRIARRRPLDVSPIPGHIVRLARDLPDVARTVIQQALRRPDAASDVMQLGVQAEHAPNRDSRVTLGTRLDPFGKPVARLDWRPTDADWDSIRRSVDLLDGAFHKARLGRVIDRVGDESPPPMYMGNSHHMGTTRMDPSPLRGVVDPTGRLHSVANLYVAGSSVFPTSGFANPTLTIVALALRLADELRPGPWGET
jgi:choline dehydrogenase-like flavoprotein